MTLFKKDSYAYTLLITIALVGEYPWRSLDMIEGNDRIIKRVLLKLKKEGFITVVGSGDEKTIRITKKIFPYLEEIEPIYLEYYLSITDNHHFRGGVTVSRRQIWRNHRLAEVIMMMKNLNCKLWPNEKAKLFLKSSPESGNKINKNDIIFYTSREIKNADIQQRYKTEFTRIMGMLFSPGGIYCIYNTNKSLIKWNSYGENKAQVLTEDIVKINYDNDIHVRELSNAIIFGKSVDLVSTILNSTGGQKDGNGFELLSFDNTFQNIFFITLDENGLKQMSILTERDWHRKIKLLMFPDHLLDFNYLSVDCDAYDKENQTYILMFFDSNIGRLKRFRDASLVDGNSKYEIICFDWQKEMLEKYIGSNITLKIVTWDQVFLN